MRHQGADKRQATVREALKALRQAGVTGMLTAKEYSSSLRRYPVRSLQKKAAGVAAAIRVATQSMVTSGEASIQGWQPAVTCTPLITTPKEVRHRAIEWMRSRVAQGVRVTLIGTRDNFRKAHMKAGGTTCDLTEAVSGALLQESLRGNLLHSREDNQGSRGVALLV